MVFDDAADTVAGTAGESGQFRAGDLGGFGGVLGDVPGDGDISQRAVRVERGGGDGIGFDLNALPAPLLGEASGRFGLKALRERIEQLEGTFTLESTPGSGTTIAVALPAVEASAPPGDLRVEEQG